MEIDLISQECLESTDHESGSWQSSKEPYTGVAGPSRIKVPSYMVSNTHASGSTSSLGIRSHHSASGSTSSHAFQDQWRLTPDYAPSGNSSRACSMPRNDEWYPAMASESRTFEILYVPDPSRAMKKKEAEINLGWANRDITPAQFESIKHLTGFVYKNGTRKNKIKVVMTE